MTQDNKNKYGYSSQQYENRGQRQFQLQEQVELTAHQKKLAFNVFHNTVEAFEEYAEKINCPNFRKQIFTQSINSPNRSPDDLADDFLTQLYCLKAMFNSKPDFLRDEAKGMFYKWVDATGININSCPEKLKHFLFEINEVLGGGGERFVKQMENKLDNSEKATPSDALKVFSAFQNPINENRKQAELLKGKTYKDIKIESKFDDADGEKGKEVFEKIRQEIASKQDNFSFYPQQNQQLVSSGGVSLSNLTNYQIIQDVKTNPQNWKIDEVITEYDNYGRAVKKEIALIHSSAEIGFDGEVFGNQPVYLPQRFNQAEISEINQALNISQSSSSTYQQKYSKSDLTKTENTNKSNKDNKVGTIATISIFSALVIGGVILVARKLNKKVKK